MTSDTLFSSEDKKWQQMLAIVTQQSSGIQPLSKSSLTKLFLMRLFFENFLVFLLQYTGLMISTINSYMPIQFATGTACAFIFLRGYTILPGLWLGSFLAYYFAHFGIGNTSLFSTIISLQAAIIFWISCRFIQPTLIFYRKLPLLKFIICISTITAITSLVLTNPVGWLTRWLANLMSILSFSFAIISWDAFFPQIDSLKKQCSLVLILYFSIIIMTTIAILFSPTLFYLQIFAFLCLASHLIISYRYGWFGAVSGIFLSGLVISFGAALIQVPDGFLYLQIFLISTSLILYFTCNYIK